MVNIMAVRKINSKVFVFIATMILVIVVLVAGYLLFSVFDTSNWVAKKEYNGIELGMKKQEVINILKQIGVQAVLPSLNKEIIISGNNVSDIPLLDGAPGICVSNTSEGISLQVTFYDDGKIANALYGSSRKFNNFSGFVTFDSFVSQLQTLLLGEPKTIAYACIPENSWIRIPILSAKDAQHLERYDLWLFDEPGTYSRVRLRFINQHLSIIEYRKQKTELP